MQTIRTQQGFSQHTINLPEEDAKIYMALLERNKIWYVNETTGERSPNYNKDFHDKMSAIRALKR